MAASTTARARYSTEDLRKDAARIAELTRQAKVALADAGTIADRIAEESSPVEIGFVFEGAIRDAATSIRNDIIEGETPPASLAEYGADLAKLVEFACKEASGDA